MNVRIRNKKQAFNIFLFLEYSWFSCGNIKVYSINLGWLYWYIDIFWSKEIENI